MAELTIQVYGAGSETCHVSLTKKAYTWWEQQDTDMLETYISSWSDDDYDFEVPEFANFLEGGAVYDADGMIDHYFRIGWEEARIEIEVDGKSVFAEDDTYIMVGDVVIGDEQDPDEVDIRSSTTWTKEEQSILDKIQDKKYMVTYESVEKGTFFDATVKIDDKFDKASLTVFTAEDWRTGEDKIADITYNGKNLDNDGGDSTGKGIYAHVWKHGE